MTMVSLIHAQLLLVIYPLLLVPSLCQSAAVIDVVDHGAVGDGTTDDTAAIRKALNLAAARTCSREASPITVLFPWGRTFLTGPFNLTTNVTLHVDGTIQAINGYNKEGGSDYIRRKWPQLPPLPSYGNSRDGRYLQHQAIIYANNAANVRITGTGIIDGGGLYWWNYQFNHTALPAGRPNLIQFVNCTEVTIDSVTLLHSPFWTVHPVQCTDVHIHHTTIRAKMYAPNVDGIDPDSCRNVMIENNDIGVGDDHIAIKAGVCGTSSPNDCRMPEFWERRVYSTQNVTVRNNIFRIGMGIAVGSESSGSIRNVNIYDNIVGLCDHGHCNNTCCGWGPALHIKTTPTRGGIIENVVYRNNTVYNNTSFILVEMSYQSKDDEIPKDYPPTLVRNVSFIDNHALGRAVGATFDCAENDACEGFVVINNTVAAARVDHNVRVWNCHNIKTFSVSGNTPPGLDKCMEQSMNQTAAGIVSSVYRSNFGISWK